MKKFLSNSLFLILLLSFSNLFSQQSCTNPSLINEYGTTIFENFKFTWDNYLPIIGCGRYESTIEFFNDNTTNPNTMVTYPSPYNPNGGGNCSYGDVNSTYIIDFFNTNTFLMHVNNLGIGGSKCTWWRIVIVGTECPTKSSECKVVTPWHFVEY